jgi:uncharacterized protein (DUF736 family)
MTTMIIGHFQECGDRLTGIIQTLCFSSDAVFIPIDPAEHPAADYRVSSGDTDLGLAWRERMPGDQPFLLVQLDDPSFPNPSSAA